MLYFSSQPWFLATVRPEGSHSPVECARLEIGYAARHRGFKSLSLRRTSHQLSVISRLRPIGSNGLMTEDW